MESIPQDMPFVRNSLYGYFPTRWVCAVFVGLFGTTTFIHMFQAVHYRLWWIIPTVLACGMAEVIGWTGRLWSSFEPLDLNPYLMQICTTIMAPSFFTAALFTMLGIVIRRLGTQYSWLTPRWYLFVFITLDVTALVVQAIGGARAAIAAQTGEDPEPGGKIMMYGIITQLVGITIYCFCQLDFLIRYKLNRPVRDVAGVEAEEVIEKGSNGASNISRTMDHNTRIMLVAMGWETIWIYIRSIYRTIELAEGWTGRIIETESYFNILDGMPIVIVMFTANIYHPGRWFGEHAITLGRTEKAKLKDSEAKVADD